MMVLVHQIKHHWLGLARTNDPQENVIGAFTGDFKDIPISNRVSHLHRLKFYLRRSIAGDTDTCAHRRVGDTLTVNSIEDGNYQVIVGLSGRGF